MPKYSDELLDEIRSRVDIVDVVSRYVHLKRSGSNYFGLCPFHNEKTPSFSVTPSKQMYYCYGCHRGGNVFNFLMEEEGLTFPEAVQELAGEAGVELPQGRESAEDRREADLRTSLYEINKEAAVYYYRLLHSDHGRAAYTYFRERALTEDTITAFGLGYADKKKDDLYQYLKGRGFTDDALVKSGLVEIKESRGAYDIFFNRAMFPIMDVHNKVIAFGGRVIGDGRPKYLNSPETPIFNKRRTLYGMHRARASKRKGFILCEGYMDVIQMHQAGFDNTIASLGTALTEENVEAIVKYKRPVYLSYDSDGAGVDAAKRAVPMFRKHGMNVRVINMRPAKDPDEFIKAYGAAEYEKRIEDAENGFLFLVRQEKGQYDLSDPGQKTEFERRMADMLIENFPEELERENYLAVLCRDYGMPEEAFRKLVAAEAGKGIARRVQEETSDRNAPAAPPGGRTVRRQSADDGLAESKRLLLSWTADNQEVFDAVKGYITPENFGGGIYQKIAEAIWNAREQKQEIVPAKLLDSLRDPREIDEAARIFHTSGEGIETPEDWNKALHETVVKIRQQAFQEKFHPSPGGTPAPVSEMIREKKELEELKRHRFSIGTGTMDK